MVADAGAREANNRRFDLTDPRDLAEDRRFRGSFSGYETNAFFCGGAPGEPYLEAAVPLGLGLLADGRAVAPLDFDDDGDLDLVLAGLQGIRLLENVGIPPDRKALSISLRARRGHPLALGARVYVRAGGRTTMDRVRLTDGFHTQSSPRLHFGLGSRARADSVEVRWPSGRRERFGAVAAGRWTLVEGTGRPRAIPRKPWPREARPQGARAYALDTATKTIGGTLVGLRPKEGVPLVVNFWGPSCAACARELPMLAALAQARPEMSFVAVSVETEDPRAVRKFAAEKGLLMPIRLATDETIEAFFPDPGSIVLPTTFVFGADGQLRRRFTREVDRNAILAALADTPAAPEDYDTLSRFSGVDGLAQLKKAIELAPNDGHRYDRLAEVSVNFGELKTAEMAARRAVALDPHQGSYWKRLDSIFRQMGKAGELDALFSKAPETAAVLALRAQIREERKDYPAALDFFRRSAERSPGSIVALQQVLRIQNKLRLEGPARETRTKIGALQRAKAGRARP